MVIARENVLKQISEMPETFSIDDLMERLYFIYKIETALQQSKNNQVTSHEEIKKKYQRWSK
jgi:hypothetical protein